MVFDVLGWAPDVAYGGPVQNRSHSFRAASANARNITKSGLPFRELSFKIPHFSLKSGRCLVGVKDCLDDILTKCRHEAEPVPSVRPVAAPDVLRRADVALDQTC